MPGRATAWRWTTSSWSSSEGMTAVGGHIRARWRGAGVLTFVSLLGLALTAACARESEAALRDRLDHWFAIGDTVAFEARGDCLAAVFRLTSADVKAPMPVMSDPMGMLLQIKRAGRAALDSSRQSPDAGLVTWPMPSAPPAWRCAAPHWRGGPAWTRSPKAPFAPPSRGRAACWPMTGKTARS